MKHASSRELYEHWNRLRGCNRAPARRAIEPTDLRRILGDVFILEVIDRFAYRFRLVGTHICAAFGREMKGEEFLDLFADIDVRSVSGLLADVTDDAVVGVLGTQAISRSGRTAKYEILLLPLASDAHDPGEHAPAFDRILGVMPAMERPFWIGSDPLTRHEVSSLRLTHAVEARSHHGIAVARVIPVKPPAVVPVAPRSGTARFVVLEGGKR